MYGSFFIEKLIIYSQTIKYYLIFINRYKKSSLTGEVFFSETIREDSILIELSVAESDMGKIIGRSGKIAKAIRSIVKAATSKSDKKVILEIR